LSTGTQIEIEALQPEVEPRQPRRRPRRALIIALFIFIAALLITGVVWRFRSRTSTGHQDIAVVRRGEFVRTLRVNGTVEAVQFLTIAAPRLSGSGGSLIVTRLVPNGKSVHKGDVLVEFDSQAQIKEALDREAEYKDLLQQILKKKADQASLLAADRTELVAAENSLRKARLELRRNEVISQIDAEKNRESMEEAKATLEQLQQTFELKRRAAQAELRTLEIQRDRAMQAMQYARQNTEKVMVRAPLDGVVVLNSLWKNGQMSEVQEGDQVRPGTAFLKLVNPVSMQVRARVNQTDVAMLSSGQPVRVTLDAYPELSFSGRTGDVAAVGQTSNLNERVRYYPVLFSITGNEPRLMPDLSAAVDVELERMPGALIAPRDALVRTSGGWLVYRKSGGTVQKLPVTVAAMSDLEAVLQTGVTEGTQLLRNPLSSGGRQ
jgi:multidrug resistance efflux pump